MESQILQVLTHIGAAQEYHVEINHLISSSFSDSLAARQLTCSIQPVLNLL